MDKIGDKIPNTKEMNKYFHEVKFGRAKKKTILKQAPNRKDYKAK